MRAYDSSDMYIYSKFKKNIGYMKHISPYFDIHHRINNKTTAILIYSNILKIISKGKKKSDIPKQHV